MNENERAERMFFFIALPIVLYPLFSVIIGLYVSINLSLALMVIFFGSISAFGWHSLITELMKKTPDKAKVSQYIWLTSGVTLFFVAVVVTLILSLLKIVNFN